MKDNRPKNINPLTIKLPTPAIVSIGHRISGVVIFLFIPLFLYVLNISLQSETAFLGLQAYFQPLWAKILLWGFMVALIFHLLAGTRHMLMDCHFADSLKAGKIGAILVLLISTFAAVLVAWCIRGVA